jgi:biopolymer transport protein ExbB/TolQ
LVCILIKFVKGGLTIIKILIIVALIAAACCIIAAIACLVAASREIELPDIEDIEIVD